MDFTEVLKGRRMVRHYRPDPVPAETLRRIVRVVRRAPSAGHSQGHRLAVIIDPAPRQQLAAIAEPWYLEHGHQPWISQAPAHIAIGVREASYHERYTESDKLTTDGTEIPWPIPFWWFDAGALFMLLQLAAIDEGLATGFYSPAPPEQLDALAQIAQFPDDVTLVGVLTLGYPADPHAPPSPRLTDRRKPLDELVTWLD